MTVDTAAFAAADLPTIGPLYTTAEVARLLRVHQRTIQEWVHTGLLPALRYGRVWRIRQADLVTFGWCSKCGDTLLSMANKPLFLQQ
jgi:excisionase family DNA binding protein